jgi:hypothetical protein
MGMDDQRTAQTPGPEMPVPGPAAAHMSGRRGPSRRALAIGAVLVVAAAGAVGATVLLRDDGGGGGGQGVALLPAASPGRADFTDDLDLLAPDQRAQPAAERVRLPYVDLDEPVALAGLGIRGAEAGLYTATRGEPTCDVDRLTELLLGEGPEGGADPAADAWFAAVARNIDENERDDYLDDLTAVRLRVDTRVVTHAFPRGEPVPYPAVLQAGTAVLVDELGVPRVRCTGGTPLRQPDPAADVESDTAAANPDDAWPGFDPAAVVVVDARAADDGFELAAGDAAFVRALGSNGDRDRGVFTPTPDLGCGSNCHVLDIAITAAEGTPTSLSFDGVADPSEQTPQHMHWDEAGPTTYKYSVVRDWATYRAVGPDDDVSAIMTAYYADPAREGELMLQPDPLTGMPVLLECVKGPVTVTITVDGTVAQTVDQDVDCGTMPLEFVLD